MPGAAPFPPAPQRFEGGTQGAPVDGPVPSDTVATPVSEPPAPPLVRSLAEGPSVTRGASRRRPPPAPPPPTVVKESDSPELPRTSSVPLTVICVRLVSWMAPPPDDRFELQQPPRNGTRVGFPLAAPPALPRRTTSTSPPLVPAVA